MEDRIKNYLTVEERLAKTDAFIPYGRQWVSEEDVQYVSSVLQSPFITTGPVATAFEQALCKLTGAKHAIVCSNGTTALHLAARALNIGSGDLGITSPITFLASANCIEYCGGRTDFVDIDPITLCISPEKLEQYCRTIRKPKVVVAVDFAGVPADLAAIKKLSEKYGFYIIEDAAHSIGSSYTYEGIEYKCGSCAHTDCAIFSFHPVKTITCGEGGAVLTNDDKLASRVRNLYTHGMVRLADIMERNDGPWYYEMAELGYNYRITDFQCALGLSQLKRLESFKIRRREIVDRYNNAFSGKFPLIALQFPQGSDVCPHLYPLQFKEGKAMRHKVFHDLRKYKIYCQIHYIPVYWQPYYRNKYGFAEGKCPNAENYYYRCISLPLFPQLLNEEVDFIAERIKSII
jgi:perosamine synthetase